MFDNMSKIFANISILMFLITRIHGEQIHDSLKSWKNVTRFDIQKSGKSGVMATMETDDFKQGVVEFKLHQRSTLHGNHLEPSVKDCLYEGFVMHESEVDVNSPVRLKHCSDVTGKLLELSGLIFLNEKVFTLHLNEDGSIILFNDDDVRKDALKTRHCAAKDKDSPRVHHKFSPEEENSILKWSKRFNQGGVSRNRRQTSYQQQERSYVEILVAISNEYFQHYGSVQTVSLCCTIFLQISNKK